MDFSTVPGRLHELGNYLITLIRRRYLKSVKMEKKKINERSDTRIEK